MDDETDGEADHGGAPPTTDDGAADGTDDPDGVEPGEIPDGAMENHWKQLILEMEKSAEEHRHAGWQTAILHPTASGVIEDDEPGIGVVVRREEFDGLDEIVSTHEIDEYEVLRADLPGEIQTLTILYTADAEVAIFVPAAVDEDRLQELRAAVGDTFYTHVTPPEDDATISFTHDDPSLFFPGAEVPRTAQTREGTAGTSDQSAADPAPEGSMEDEDP